MPGYIVYRDSAAGQPFDATAPLAFYPPKDSDELFDALRTQFPHLKTHSERMREATIAYLIQERTEEQSPAPMTTPQTVNTAATSPWLSSFPSMSTGSSTFSSPDMLDLATPSYANSPQPARPFGQQHSAAVASNTTSPPALEDMTGVFSLSDSTQPKQRVRRKMTEAEKVDYRKRRIVKACDKCSKRKRKCEHNKPEIENLAKPAQKVQKAKSAAHHKKPAVTPLSLSPDPAPDSISDAEPFIQGDDWFDFTLLEDPMPEMSFDDLLGTDLDKPLEKQQYIHFQQPWSTDQDFSGMFTDNVPSQAPNEDQTLGNVLDMQQGLFLGDSHAEASAMGFTTGNKKYPVGVQPQQQLPSGAYEDCMLHSDLGVQQDVLGLGMLQQATIPHRALWDDYATSGDAMYFDGHFEGTAGEPSAYSGESAPRKELTRNIKNPIAGDVLHYFDDDDRSVHQSEATSKSRTDRFGQANPQNRANVRSVEGSGTKDLLQAATRPQHMRLRVSQDHQESPIGQAHGDDHPIDLSAELYRLRHGVPGRNARLQTRLSAQQAMSRAETQINGEAYRRLDTNAQDIPTPSLTGLSAILPAIGAEKPVHTRPRNRIASDSYDDTDQRDDNSKHGASARPATGAEKPARNRTRNASASSSPGDSFERGEQNAFAEDTGATGLSHSSRPRAHGRSPLTVATTAQSMSAKTDSSSDVYQERLNGTNRHRDHFGRMALAVCATVITVMLLLLLSQSSSFPIPTSTLLLAAFAPSEALNTQMFGKRKWKSYRTVAGGGEAGSAQSDKFFGWVMTPHSSLRWSVGTLCA